MISQISNNWHRYLYPQLQTKEKLLGIKGLRGVGKTTMLLQYLAYDYPDKEKGLYVTADHPWFYRNSLFDLASEWYRYGGELLLIDEVHKKKNYAMGLLLAPNNIFLDKMEVRKAFKSFHLLGMAEKSAREKDTEECFNYRKKLKETALDLYDVYFALLSKRRKPM